MEKEEICSIGAHMANYGLELADKNLTYSEVYEMAMKELDSCLPFPLVALKDEQIKDYYFKAFIGAYFYRKAEEWTADWKRRMKDNNN